MRKTFRTLVAALAALFLVGSLSACASEPISLANVAAVIDVRTPEEFAGGHLEGAVNINVESPDFAAQIATLEKGADYVVYCRSGRRSGLAIDAMKAAGFTGQLTNAGGIDQATSSLGLPIVVK